MLGGIRLKVVYGQEKTCFVYISQKYCSNTNQSQCVQVISKDKKVLLWVVYSNNIPEGQVACNPIYCRLLGLEEGSYVFVCPYGDVKVLDELYIDTDSPDDQEILEHNVETLQLRILDQLRFVVAHQKAIVWISSSMPIVFTPKKTGLLVNHSQVIVKMDAFNSFYESLQSTASEAPQKDIKFNNIGIINNGLLKPYMNAPKRLVLRALPIDSDGKKNLVHPYTIFIHEDLIDKKYKDLTIILATMTNIPTVQQENKEEEDKENNNNQINDLCVEIVPINNIVYQSLCQEIYNQNIPTALIPKSLNTIINIENGCRIILTIIGDQVDQPEQIDILTYTEDIDSESNIVERFKNFVIESTHAGKKFLINADMVKQNNQICTGFLKFKLKPEKLKYTMLNSESFRQCSVVAKCLPEKDLDLPKPINPLQYDLMNYCRSMRSVQELVDKVVKHLYFEIHREATFKGVSEIKSNVLVTGLSGTGKSSLCYIIQKELTVFSHVLHCRSLKGRKDIPEVLSKAILLCQEHSPAVLICDDLDSLVPANLEGAPPLDIAYYQRLAVTIKQLLQSCAGVCVLMTSLGLKDLHPTLAQFAGKPLFTAQFNIPELDKEERIELLKHLLNDKIHAEFTIEDDDVIKMAIDTAGSTVRNVIDYLNKQIFKAVKRKNETSDGSKPRLVEAITENKEKTNEFDIWGPVGGLEQVKQKLTECIFWPIMYAPLFKTQSCGVLLYGPPGCGKSLIGSCLARLTNMSLIVVKGPELLSKYIGQSEKAVRDVFDKADMKRPSILFFDEFDSLAPKRGHDSTGVTDRVVNQLLSRLDGAEGGARGAVLAATARPDLVDAALLRPGRLHVHVYVPPADTQEERYSVLRTLSRDVSLSPSVDLRDVARRTPGFSPADLRALLVTAQLGKLETMLDESEGKEVESVEVTSEDIESALAETKPSLSKEQRAFYDTIYRKFRGEKLTTEQKAIENEMQKQRVTLA